MNPNRNRQFLLVNRPTGEPDEADFMLVEQPIPVAGSGEVLVRILYLSIDPYFRFYMSEVTPLIAPHPLQEVFGGDGVGQVIVSNHDRHKVGDIVKGNFGWKEYAVAAGDRLERVSPEAPASAALGLLGTTGLTAYFGLMDIGKPVPGETVVISSAAGAVGTAVGQIAKLQGCRVVGIAGSERKARYLLDEIGFDAIVNYNDADWRAALHKACPDGIDVYFDNVGGGVSDTVVTLLNRHARIAVCGQTSHYNGSPAVSGTSIPFALWKTSALMKGFMLYDYESRFDEALSQMIKWFREGKLLNHEHVVEGFEQAPRALIGLFRGDNIGKMIVKVADL
ncbi:NADP-dependent oxidoreductase [Paenibacillus allorhizosphaerae]|uniref:NADP-dependent oxidoreductase YfmJ n=1 Tax=Paenibacillus allorhizosphaerae TaxID=2849866 RepID=A0ABM8VR10_9BACL|nr:NADP-dependent oxidoreductase [Paenibacillus allorhizosphaerae]CAG7654773.1 Putative NADP-dependent oxidoreductase YfmJ [Paenibacillus allorhizosphaerae]